MYKESKVNFYSLSHCVLHFESVKLALYFLHALCDPYSHAETESGKQNLFPESKALEYLHIRTFCALTQSSKNGIKSASSSSSWGC